MLAAMERAHVAIVGAGPIGLEVAVALRQAGVRYVQFEAGQIGATMDWWAPGTRFFSSPERIAIAGVPLVTEDGSKATREQYLAYLRAVVQQFDLPVRSYERVERIRREGEGFVLWTRRSLHGVGGPAELRRTAPAAEAGDLTAWRVGRVVLAIGDLHRPRRLHIPGEDLPHATHFFEGPHRYFRRRVLIVGGKNSAVEAALRCWHVGCHVTISYRGDVFDPRRVKSWLLPELEWLIRTGRIEFEPRSVPERIEPEHVVLVRDGRRWEQPADFVLLMTGYEQDSGLFEQLGVELMGPGRVPKFDPATMETSVPGVYVAGTASAGTQVGGVRVFIENAHDHGARIAAAITRRPAPPPRPVPEEQFPEA